MINGDLLICQRTFVVENMIQQEFFQLHPLELGEWLDDVGAVAPCSIQHGSGNPRQQDYSDLQAVIGQPGASSDLQTVVGQAGSSNLELQKRRRLGDILSGTVAFAALAGAMSPLVDSSSHAAALGLAVIDVVSAILAIVGLLYKSYIHPCLRTVYRELRTP